MLAKLLNDKNMLLFKECMYPFYAIIIILLNLALVFTVCYHIDQALKTKSNADIAIKMIRNNEDKIEIVEIKDAYLIRINK